MYNELQSCFYVPNFADDGGHIVFRSSVCSSVRHAFWCMPLSYEPVTMHGFRNFIYGFLMTKGWPIFFFLLALLSLNYRQASLSVRCPHSSNISSGIAGPIKARFQMEPQWGRGTEVCSNDPGHVTKMVAMPIYGKNPLKIFFSRTKGPMTLGLAMYSCSIGFGPKKVSSNDDLGLTLTFFLAILRSNLLPYAFVWENVHFFRENVRKFNGRNSQQMTSVT